MTDRPQERNGFLVRRRFRKASKCYLQGDIPEAITHLEKALESEPENLDALNDNR